MKKYFLFFCLGFLLPLPSFAAVLNVPGVYANIRAAANAASNGDTIVLANATYTGPDNRNIDLDGKSLTIRSASDKPSQCIIDCEHNSRAFSFTDCDKITIEGITVKNGSVLDKGGAVYCLNSSLTVRNCIFSDNISSGHGGAVYSYYDSTTEKILLVFTDCSFTANTAQSNGGGASINRCHSSFIDCQFTDNSAYNGGGVHISQGKTSSFSGCEFQNNTAGGAGGGVNVANQATFSHCNFFGNHSNSSGGAAYAFYNSHLTTFSDCLFSANEAKNNGGAIDTSSPKIERCVFVDNTSKSTTKGGGALYLSSKAVVVNCFFCANTAATDGGAAYIDSYYPPPDPFSTFTNCTFTQNTATRNGGALWCDIPRSLSEDTLSMKNCILWDDKAVDGDEIFEDGLNMTVTYSDIAGGHSGTGNLNIDPQLILMGECLMRLRCDSPCIDAGTDEAAPADDLAGFLRPVGVGVDMGAYEYHYDPITWKGKHMSENGNSWNLETNWFPEMVPLQCSSVLIEDDHSPTQSPLIYTSQMAVARSLTITGRCLTISGCLTLGGG
jgi:predicted outer membrane repeat protein